MRRLAKLALLTASLTAAGFALSGCGGMRAEEFAGNEPRFLVEEYFAGQTRAWGLFQDRFGNVRRQFTVDIEGRPTEDGITLIEDFVYSDGETERRVWEIRRTGEHTYEGRADGVVGTARGQAYGNALNWSYDFDLQVGDRTWRVHFDDWMFLQPDGVMINRASVTKFGLEVGEAIIFFRKIPAEQAEDESARMIEQDALASSPRRATG
jgi:hypothetical protein